MSAFQWQVVAQNQPLVPCCAVADSYQWHCTLFFFSEDSRNLGPGNCKSKSAKEKILTCQTFKQLSKGLSAEENPADPITQFGRKKQTRSHTMKVWPKVNSLLLPSTDSILRTLLTVKDINKHLPCLEAPRFARGLEHFLSVLRLFSQSALR